MYLHHSRKVAAHSVIRTLPQQLHQLPRLRISQRGRGLDCPVERDSDTLILAEALPGHDHRGRSPSGMRPISVARKLSVDVLPVRT